MVNDGRDKVSCGSLSVYNRKNMDRITRQLVDDFLASQEIKSISTDKDFELFANYSALSREYNQTFDVKSITIGAGNDTGIDGIAIIVNGYLVDDIDEVNDLLSRNGYIEVTYIFIQAKASPHFEGSKLNNFCFGVKDFFAEQPGLTRNEDVRRFADLSNSILNLAASFRENPKCKMYYITTGQWNEDSNHIAVINNSKRELSLYNLFSDIDFFPVGAIELSKLYRQTKNPNDAEFIFKDKVTLPEISGIGEAYYGIIPFIEFKKILVDDNDNIRSVFDDNVRDFQGENNLVNKKISATITDEKSCHFVILNNGVTVVARKLKTSGNKFMISDFQIVNGCQTSNILYINRDKKDITNLHLPFRLIVTDDDLVKSQITLATNNQTAIKTEQLAALSEFQRNLELYYAATKGEGKLFYERRAKQYNNDNTVIKNRIITVAVQIKSFSAMFLQNPHLVTSFFGTIAKKCNEQGSLIFKADHSYAPYYLSSLAFYKLDGLFRSNSIDGKYRKVRFHLLMLFRLFAEEEKPPQLTDKKTMEKYCQVIIDKILNYDICLTIFSKAINVIDSSEINLSDKQHMKQASIVENILETYKSKFNNL